MTGARYRSIADDLRERIALGDVGDGGQLDSEAALGTRYDASRVTVRKALDLLRERGLVESRRGAGWFVAGGSYHQRLALGSFRHAASAVAEAGRSLRREVVSFSWQRPTPAAAQALSVPSGQDVLHCRSVRTDEQRPLDLVSEWIPGERAAHLSRADAADPGLWQSLARSGNHVATVTQTITAGVAGEQDAALLGVATGTPLLLVRRLARDTDGTPMALSDHRYLAHRFSLEVEFHEWSPEGPPGLRETPEPS